MSADPKSLAATYFEAWQTPDVQRLRSILADDVSFRGPLAQVDGADEYADSFDPRGILAAAS